MQRNRFYNGIVSEIKLYWNKHVTIMTFNDINLTYNGYKFQRINVLSLSPDSVVNDSPN